MSSHSDLDRQSFQDLLANAFAVQQSQIDRQSLSAFVEIQRLIARGELDAAGTMNLLVESARCVANAAGVAIGLLQGDQLIYRAGSGSATADVGRAWTASLTASADTIANREILRVENAEGDTRIQAAICRQLGAKSVLILLICKQHVPAGVLEVRFSEAHAFEESEVRTYRLMTALIEEAMLHATQLHTSQLEQKENLPAVPHAGQIAPQGEMLPGWASAPRPTGAIYQRCASALAVYRQSPVFRQPALLATMLAARIAQRVKEVTRYKSPRGLALAGVTTVLALTCWVVYKGRGPVSPPGPSAATGTSIEKQAPLQQAKPPAAKAVSKRRAKPVRGKEVSHASTAGRRVQVNENEVDYIRGNVTVRYFTYQPATQPRPKAKARIAQFGEDVTVRYFTPEPAPPPASR